MAKVTYANGRQQLPFDNSKVVVSTGGTNTQARSLYFAIQGQNPAGKNLLSSVVGPIAIASGQQVTITIDTNCRLAGEWWTDFVISANTTNDVTTFVQVAKIPGNLTLPQTVVLNSDEDFKLSNIVATPSNLPAAADVLHGALRGITSLDAVYEYDAFSTKTANGINVLTATTGRWLLKGVSFSSYVASVTGIGGCAQDVNDLAPDEVILPTYAVDGTVGTTQKFWLVNDSTADEPAGRRVGVTVLVNDEPKTTLFNNLIKVIFRGYADTELGTLRTTDTLSNPLYLLDQEVGVKARKSNLILSDPLAPDEAMVLEFYPKFSASDLNKLIPRGSVIALFPFFYDQAGEYTEAGAPLGNLIYNRGDYRLLVPGVGLLAKALSGGGLVEFISFLDTPESVVAGFTNNQNNQIVAVNGNGVVLQLTVPSSDQAAVDAAIGMGLASALRSLGIMDETEDVRAIIGTANGEGFATAWSGNFANTGNQVFTISSAYPCDADGNGTIRSNYPDTRLRGRVGYFNPSEAVIYVKRVSDSEIRKFPVAVVTIGTSQSFAIPNWSTGTVTTVAVPSDDSFGLYAPGTPTATITAGTSDYAAGDYQFAIAFKYTNVITSISHSEYDGCLLTLDDIDMAKLVLRSRDSTRILAGEGTPSPSLDIDGSFYLDKLNNDFYGPKTNGDWGTPVSLVGTQGPPGVDGVIGFNAYTDTTAQFTVPNANSNVTISVVNSDWMVIGQLIYIQDAGTYEVVSKSDSTSAVVKNKGNQGNAAPSTVISTGRAIAPTGTTGAAGTSGYTTTSAQFTVPGVNSTTVVDVIDSGWISVNLIVFVATAGYFKVINKAGLQITLENLGESGNASPTTVINPGVVVSSGGAKGATGNTGATGATGATGSTGSPGQNAFTTTTASFSQPNVGNNVTISVGNSDWIGIGQIIFIYTGGYYQVIDVPTSNSIQIQNLGYSENATPGSSINSASNVVPGGSRGAAGATGSVSATSDLTLTEVGVAPSTAANEIKIYNLNNELFGRLESNGTEIKLGNYQSTLFLNAIATPSTAALQYGLFVDNSDNLFKIRNPSNGATNFVGFTQNALFLQPVSTPTTPATARALFTDSADGLLKTRDANSGTTRTLASLNRVQAYTQVQSTTPVSQNITGSVTLDGSASNSFYLTVTGIVTSLSINNLVAGTTYNFRIIQGATPYAVTLAAVFKAADGDTTTISTTANKISRFCGEAISNSVVERSPILVYS